MSDVSKERVKLLVEALRDPAAKQTRQRLADHRGYCCLGLACEVAIANGLDVNREVQPGIHHGTFEVAFDGTTLTLPESVRKWYGFERADPALGGTAATILNDEDRLTLPEIADCFEQEFLAGEPL